MENAQLKRLVLLRRGGGRDSISQGSSVHNQQKERFWRNMRKVVTEYSNAFSIARKIALVLMLLVK